MRAGVDMITRAEVEKLGAIHVAAPAILSVYLTVPSHPGEPGDLAMRGRELIAGAETAVPTGTSRRLRCRGAAPMCITKAGSARAALRTSGR